MPFFTFSQNNSRGRWKGPLYVIVEATNAKHANFIAEEHTEVYFDARAGDCIGCCGYRWSETSDHEATVTPEIYGKPAKSLNEDSFYKGLKAQIFYLNGEKEEWDL